MQNSLFPEPEESAAPDRSKRRAQSVSAATHDPALNALAAELPQTLRLGTSSWNYPGWIGSVWAEEYPEAKLSKQGLRAYAEHPLLRTVSLDRAFYRPLTASQYAGYAAQVPEDFRFVVKAPSLIADALVRNEDGRGLQSNPQFLDPGLAIQTFVLPALEGLQHRLGALLFQLSPLPGPMLARLPAVIDKLGAMLRVLPKVQPFAPDAVVAVEVRNAEFLNPESAPSLIQALRNAGATYCLGLHAKMPPIAEQLPILRALWPAPLVCRWNLHRRHGAYGYEEAKRLYGNFDRLVDPDVDTRQMLARVVAGTTAAGHPAYVTVSNKAEGSAPLSVAALAQSVSDALRTSQREADR